MKFCVGINNDKINSFYWLHSSLCNVRHADLGWNLVSCVFLQLWEQKLQRAEFIMEVQFLSGCLTAETSQRAFPPFCPFDCVKLWVSAAVCLRCGPLTILGPKLTSSCTEYTLSNSFCWDLKRVCVCVSDSRSDGSEDTSEFVNIVCYHGHLPLCPSHYLMILEKVWI